VHSNRHTTGEEKEHVSIDSACIARLRVTYRLNSSPVHSNRHTGKEKSMQTLIVHASKG
jgi:hypothetical protein